MFELALGLGFLAFVLSGLALFPLKRALDRWQVIDVPNDRSSHTQPKPRGGGVVIVIFTIAGGWVFYLLASHSVAWWRLLLYTLGAVLIAGVSWLDDLRSLPNRLRFAVHGLGAILAIVACGYIHTVEVPLFGRIVLGWLGLPLTFLWVVGLTNAYNFMDGIDGLAGAQGVIGGLGWAIAGWLSGQPFIGTLGLLLAASSAGFLWHNWPPSLVVMGDVSCAFLGYTFAVLPMLYNAGYRDSGIPSDRSLIAGLLFLWPFIWDSAFTFCRRLLKGENVLTAHRSHLYQRLIISGHSHRTVTCLYIGLAIVGVVVALIWVSYTAREWSLAILTVPLLAVTLWFWVKQQEREREKLP